MGLISSALAYGRVEQIKKNVAKVLDIMGPSPHNFTLTFEPRYKDWKNPFKGIKHRFNDARDIACLIYIMRQMIETKGGVGDFFMEGYNPSSKETIKDALSSFSRRALALGHSGIYGRTKKIPKNAGVRFFFPSPKDGSACKRLCLYLRWMVRRQDGLDFGLWGGVSPSSLIMPLDTHVARISRLIGLSGLGKRKTASWNMAMEVTRALRRLDPEDPVKYDFALARLGILDECPRRRVSAKCARCPVKAICVL